MEELLRKLATKAVWDALIDQFAPRWMPRKTLPALGRDYTSAVIPVRNTKDGRQFYIHIIVSDKETL